jgi:hypothetical protein
MNDELTVTSSSDTAGSVQTVADGRIAREPGSVIFTENSAVFESPKSERHLLEERLQLAEVEKDVDDALADSVTVESNETFNESESEAAEPQADVPAYVHPEHPHYARMQEALSFYGADRIRQIVQPVLEAGVDIPPGVANLIADLPNSAEVLFFLCGDPFMKDSLVELNSMTKAQAQRTLRDWSNAVTQLAEERETQPTTRRSNAPPPIRPISGSSTKSHVSIDDPNLSFQDYRKIRDKQDKARYRR